MRPEFSLRALFLCCEVGNVRAMIYSDQHLKKILDRTKEIAVVGVSMNPVRPSYYVARYLSL